VWIDQLFHSDERLTLDILFDLGIPGLSTFSSKTQGWVVRGYGSRIHRCLEGRSIKLRFESGSPPEPVFDAINSLVDRAGREFLLRYEEPEQLYAMVRDSALTSLRDRSAPNEMNRLDLEPSNVVGQLEIAAVYAAFLGLVGEAEDLSGEAIHVAGKIGVDYAIPTIRENVLRATERHAQSIT
jgi:hypothetical protein